MPSFWEGAVKSLLGRIALRKSIGLAIGDEEVALSLLAATPFGPRELQRQKLSYVPGELPVVLEKLLRPILGTSRSCRIPVAVGLPARSVFFSTRPIHSTTKDPQPHVLLREALHSSNVRTETMQVDLIKSQPAARTVASIAACEQKPLEQLLSLLARHGICPWRVEPGPFALLRAAGSLPRMGRARSSLRVFLGETQGLAILVGGGLPLVWRSFGLPRGDEAAAILSASRSLAAMGQYCGLDGAVEFNVIHGGTELRHVTGFEWLHEQLGAPTEWLEGPALSEESVAYGLALGCLKEDENAFDLSRSLKPRPSLSQIFPWSQIITQAALLAGLGMFLLGQVDGLTSARRNLHSSGQKHRQLDGVPEANLLKQKQQLEEQTAAIRQFLETRVLWTNYLRDIPQRMPDNLYLMSVQGECEMPLKDKKKAASKPKKSFVVRAAAALPPDGSMPRELDRFLDSLREHPLLKKDFPMVELGGLQHFRTASRSEPLAFFTVVCLPKPESTVAKTAKKDASH